MTQLVPKPGPILVVVIVMVITRCSGQTIRTCEYDAESCGCQTDKGLVSLKHFNDLGLSTESTGETGTFYWNLCQDFTREKLTAACIQNISPGVFYDCGVHSSADSSALDGQAIFTMKSGDILRESRVRCICGSTERLLFVNEDPLLTYNLDLISKFCCPGFHTRRRRERYSIGSIVLIVFSCLIWIYFLGGIILQTFVRKAKGRERIPHINFWTALVRLIVDGFRFTFTCGRFPRHGANSLGLR